MTRVELAGIELYGFHGLLEEERKTGQRFLVDLELDYADPAAPLSDDVADAVDYREVVALVRATSDEEPCNLIEVFAARVADALMAAFPLGRVRVRVRKPDVHLDPPVDHAAAVVERRR